MPKGTTVEISYYTTESLERELREFEEIYGMSSADFFTRYTTDEVPSHVPGSDGFRWADSYSELCRLRAAAPPQLA